MLNSKGRHLIFMSGGFELYLEWQVNLGLHRVSNLQGDAESIITGLTRAAGGV